jgi:hypothetical protein
MTPKKLTPDELKAVVYSVHVCCSNSTSEKIQAHIAALEEEIKALKSRAKSDVDIAIEEFTRKPND